jgi:hypothetical protein
MRSMKLVGMAVAAVFLAAFVVAPAYAGTSENPVWFVNGSALGAGEELANVTSTNAGVTEKEVQVLKGPGVTITCTGSKSKITFLGGMPATNREEITYTGCTVSGHPLCTVSSPGQPDGTIVTTHLIASKLVFKTKAAAEKKEAKENKSVTVLTPEEGTVFTELGLQGSCGFVPMESKVTGSVIVDDISGATEPGGAASHEVSAKNESSYWINEGGSPVEKKISLKAFGLPASFEGNSVVSAPSGDTFGVEG